MSFVTLETVQNNTRHYHSHQQQQHKQHEGTVLHMNQYNISQQDHNNKQQQQQHQNHEVVSSGYSSQDGGAEASLVNYLSTLTPSSVVAENNTSNQHQQFHRYHQPSNSPSIVSAVSEGKNGVPVSSNLTSLSQFNSRVFVIYFT